MMDVNPAGYPPQVLNGNEPACKGGTWIVGARNEKVVANRYITRFGDFEVVETDVFYVMASGTYFLNGIEVMVYGMQDPYVVVHSTEKNIHLSSKKDAPQLIEDAFRRAYKGNEELFKNKLGSLFMIRMRDILEYDFPIAADKTGRVYELID